MVMTTIFQILHQSLVNKAKDYYYFEGKLPTRTSGTDYDAYYSGIVGK